MTEQEALNMGQELMGWIRASPDARMAVRGVCASYECQSLGELAVAEPVAFEMLHEAIKDMMEQIPDYWTP